MTLDGPSFDRMWVGPSAMTDLIWLSTDQTSALGVLPVSWSRYVDFGSGIGGYAAAIVNASVLEMGPLDEAIADFVPAGADASQAKVYAAVQHAQRYFSVVLTNDRLGNRRACTSDGFTFDATPPDLSRAVLRSLLAVNDRNMQRVVDGIHAEIRGAEDPESGIYQYWAALGVVGDVESLAPFLFAGNSEGEILLGGLSLPQGQVVVTVRVMNRAFEVAQASIALAVDSIPPVCDPTMYINALPAPRHSLQITSNQSGLNASWTCADAAPWESSPISCSWAVGSSPGDFDVMAWTNTSASGTHTYGGANNNARLLNGHTYFVVVSCVDQVGLTSRLVSGALMVDTAPPQVALPVTLVQPGTGRAASLWSNHDFLYAAWAFDDLESGVQEVRWGLRASATVPPYDELNSTDTNEAAFEGFLARDRVTLHHDHSYFLHACAVDLYGNLGCSDPWQFRIDLTPPNCTILEGGGHSRYFSSPRALTARWRCEDVESGITSSSWMAFAVASQNELVPLLNRRVLVEGGSGEAAALVSPYVQGGSYGSCVSAVNGAGMPSSREVCTEASTFDGTPPVDLGTLWPFQGRTFIAPHEVHCVSVGPFREDVARLAYVELVVMEVGVDGEDDVMVRSATQIIDTVPKLQPLAMCYSEPLFTARDNGRAFRMRMRAYNDAQPPLYVEAHSQTFIVDATAPLVGNATAHVHYPVQSPASSQADPRKLFGLVLVITLDDSFDDPESSIVSLPCVIYVDGEPLMNVSLIPGDERFELPLPTLRDGQSLTAKIAAVNRVGMRSSAVATSPLALRYKDIRLGDPWLATVSGDRLSRFLGPPDALSMGFRFAVDPMSNRTDGSAFTYEYGVVTNCAEGSLPSAIQLSTLRVGDQYGGVQPLRRPHGQGDGGPLWAERNASSAWPASSAEANVRSQPLMAPTTHLSFSVPASSVYPFSELLLSAAT